MAQLPGRNRVQMFEVRKVSKIFDNTNLQQLRRIKEKRNSKKNARRERSNKCPSRVFHLAILPVLNLQGRKDWKKQNEY